MTATIHRLTAAGPSLGPAMDVVEELRRLLAAAERGEVKGIGYFYASGADAVVTGWAGGCADKHLMVAGAALLAHRVNEQVA